MSSDRKDPSLNPQHQKLLRGMQEAPENRQCADCHGPSARWASTNLGCFLCIECSGIHRKLGVHISVVRSLTLDTWTPNQVAHFRSLGNVASAAIYERHLPDSFARPAPADPRAMERFIRDKYERKLYAPPEHGGLGGVDPRARAALVRRQPIGTRPDLGARPLQYAAPRPGYDFHDPPALPTRLHGDAARRAEIVGTILEMGFPPMAAARAVEAGKGDLQRAVEWVLQNEQVPDTTRPAARPSPAVAPPPPAPRPAAPPQVDLLSFDDDPPPKSSGVGHAATLGISASNTTTGVPALASKASSASSAPPPWASDDDFADFGAFESALPEASPVADPMGSIAGSKAQTGASPIGGTGTAKASGGSVSGTALSALYARGTSVHAGSHHSAFQTHNVATRMTSSRGPVSPQRKTAAIAGAVPSSGASAMSPGISKTTSPSHIRTGSFHAQSPRGTPPTAKVGSPFAEAKPISLGPSASKARAVQSSPAAPPPPPAGPSHTAFPGNPPPPPATSPPPLSELSHSPVAPPMESSPGGETLSTSAEASTTQLADSATEEKEPDDPFAGLAMFALNESRKGRTGAKNQASDAVGAEGTPSRPPSDAVHVGSLSQSSKDADLRESKVGAKDNGNSLQTIGSSIPPVFVEGHSAMAAIASTAVEVGKGEEASPVGLPHPKNAGVGADASSQASCDLTGDGFASSVKASPALPGNASTGKPVVHATRTGRGLSLDELLGL